MCVYGKIIIIHHYMHTHTQVSIELVKVVMELPRESLKNCFLSLALPSVVFSEPAAAQRTIINDRLSFTLWDKWEVRGHKTFKLQDFLKAIKVLRSCVQ